LFRSRFGVSALHLLFTAATAGLWQLIVSLLYNER